MKRYCCQLLGSFFILCALLPSLALALNIDEFLGEGSISTSTQGVPANTTTSDSSAIGGKRGLYVAKTSSNSGATTLQTSADSEAGSGDFSLSYTQGTNSGQGIITWNGNLTPSNFPANGLGSIDLLQDGGTAFLLGIIFFDFPAQQPPVDLTITLYDSTNAAKTSNVSITLSQPMDFVPAFDLTLPFTLFTTSGAGSVAGPSGANFGTLSSFGAGGAADLSKIGAIQLIINSQANSKATDLTLDYLRTNGRCDLTPNAAGRVVDQCGVCGGDGTSCLDCAGTPFGTKTKDLCNVCGGDGKSCLDCNGQPFGTANVDACGVCGGSAQSEAQCNSCVTVEATDEVLDFEKRLLTQATTLRKRFQADITRAKRTKCKLELNKRSAAFELAFKTIRSTGEDIFTKGVEVCGNSCVTVSYAEQVEQLQPSFKLMERSAKKLAKEVQACYAKVKGKYTGTGSGVTGTITNVRNGLNQLIEDCRNRQVCPPAS